MDPFSFIIFTCLTCALNTTSGSNQFSNSDTALVFQEVINSMPNGGSIFVKQMNSTMNNQVNITKNIQIQGSGIDKTIFNRGHDKNYVFYLNDSNSKISDITINGQGQSYQHSNTEIIMSGSNDKIESVKVYNFQHLGLGSVSNHGEISDCQVYGQNYTHSSYGIWAARNYTVSIHDCDIENNWLGGIYAAGTSNIYNNYLMKNHIQDYPTGGGQIAIDQANNYFSYVHDNVVLQEGNQDTIGIEIGGGKAIVSNNFVTNNLYGIVADGPGKMVFADNLLLNSYRWCIERNGFSEILNYSNICN